MIRICAVAAFALGLAAPSLAAEPFNKDIAARTELFEIHTLTLSDKQFLTGDAEAALAMMSKSRTATAPDTPTVDEGGAPGV
jgi:tripartite-type tricarboxylate transporter receptor subunit TctC